MRCHRESSRDTLVESQRAENLLRPIIRKRRASSIGALTEIEMMFDILCTRQEFLTDDASS